MTTTEKVERLSGTILSVFAGVRSAGTVKWNAERSDRNPLKTLNLMVAARGTMRLRIGIVPFHPSY